MLLLNDSPVMVPGWVFLQSGKRKKNDMGEKNIKELKEDNQTVICMFPTE
jgi:hypothetical protein